MRARHTVLTLAALLLAACDAGTDSTAPATSAPTTTPPEPGLVVDTDVAADDLVALLYLLGRPDVDVRAVTVTGAGEVTCPRGREIVQGLLQVTARTGVEVGCGPTAPLEGTRTFPAEWRAAADAAYGLDLPEVAASEDPGAVAVLAGLVDEGRPVTLLTLGPLTNVAAALGVGVDLGRVVDRVVVMGGAVDVPGNVVPEGTSSALPAEWNLWVDPAAAAAVVGSGLPVELVPLDATNAVPLGPPVVDLLAANAGSPGAAAELVLQLWQDNPMVRSGEAYLWDPLAAVATVRPELTPTVEETLSVTTGQGSFAGATRRDDTGTTVAVATVPDAPAVVDELVRGLAGVPQGAPLLPPPTVAQVGEATVSFDGTTCRYDGPTAVPAGSLRVTVDEASTVGTMVMVGHLTSGTVQEALDWSVAHPGETLPMVDAITVVGGGGLASPADVRLVPGTNGVVCTVDGSTLAVAATLTVG